MLQRFITWIREVLNRMFHFNQSDAKRLGAEINVSSEMQKAISLWLKLFQDDAPWLGDTTQSLGLPAAIAAEFARLVLVEFDSQITGSARADWLNKEYQELLQQLRNAVELACAGGGVVFKPYPDGNGLALDCVPAWRFFPTSFNSRGQVTGAIFTERVTKGSTYYTRLEHHALTEQGYVIRNMAFLSYSEESLGNQCPLDAVAEWGVLEPELTISYKEDGSAPERPLFAYFRLPFANTVDLESPLGVAVYSRAVELIRRADEQYSRILWEFEGSELAVDASVGALQRTGSDGKPAKLPQRQKRLFRELSIDDGQGDLYKVFSPEIRDTSLFNGLDKLLKRIEFNCSLAYGTLSDPSSVEKTAEEIRTSKQRSYSAVCDMQARLREALEQLVWVMDFYATLYNLAPRGEYEVSYTFGDGVMEDTDKEFARRKQLVDGGYMKPEKLLAWYFGISEEDAAEYVPAVKQGLSFEA